MYRIGDLVMFKITDFKKVTRPVKGVWEIIGIDVRNLKYTLKEVNYHIAEKNLMRMVAHAEEVFKLETYRNEDDLKDETLRVIKEYNYRNLTGGYLQADTTVVIHKDENSLLHSGISEAIIDYLDTDMKSIYKTYLDNYGFHTLPVPKKILFNSPATIVFWEDGDKTVVKCMKEDIYDKEKGFVLCLLKKMLGKKGYREAFKQFKNFDVVPDLGVKKCPKWNEDIPKENLNHRFGCIFDIGDIVKLKHGKVNFKIINVRIEKYGRNLVNRYRIQALNSPSKYTTYEVEKRLVLVKRGSQK